MKNFDSSRLPSLLFSFDGTEIKDVKAWEEKRRPEIEKFFRREVYGIFPPRPEEIRFVLKQRDDSALEGRAIQETVEISFQCPLGTYSFELYLFLPQGSGPYPMAALICNRDKQENMDITRKQKTGFWPVESIVERGWGTCAFYVGDINMDEANGYEEGIHRMFSDKQEPNGWATIAAWAWAAMRVMDYLEQDERIDQARITLTGQSRGGKTALFAGMCDTRYRAVFSSCSGCMGAALSRFKEGESIRQINEAFPYWFCEAFKKYNNHEYDMPLDQHALLATIAPRFLYVTSATEDLWADPEAEYESARQAGVVYRLYGELGLPENAEVLPNKPLHGGCIGYHRRQGEHDLTEFDWMLFLDFAEKRL